MQKTCLVVHKSSLNVIFYFFELVNKNIDAQLFMHVKNHHQHMNYLILGFLQIFHLNLLCVNVIHKK
jgi:hypothetical protein